MPPIHTELTVQLIICAVPAVGNRAVVGGSTAEPDAEALAAQE